MDAAKWFQYEFRGSRYGRRDRTEFLYLTAFKHKQRLVVVQYNFNIGNSVIAVVYYPDSKPDVVVRQDFIATF